MNGLQSLPCELFVQAVAQSLDGITIADVGAHYALVYVNHGFERLTGYSAEEIIRLGHRVLQRDDLQQPELLTLREAMQQGQACQVTLRNYRKDGSMFWNELSLSPVRNSAGTLTHYIGIQKDVTARMLLERYLQQSNLDLSLTNQKLSAHNQLDPLVGLVSREHFEQALDTMLAGALRTHSELALLVVEINHFAEFVEHYGEQAGEECLRQIGWTISHAYTRHSDCASRYSSARFVIASLEAGLEAVQTHAKKLSDKVRALGIPHSATAQGIVTLSIGGVVRVPLRGNGREDLLQLALSQLALAERNGHEAIRISH